jgi:leucyl-tRNA synthetase
MDWDEKSCEGQARFLGRVFRFVTRSLDAPTGSGESDTRALRKLHQTIRKVTQDFDNRFHFNTSIAGLMELTNELYLLESGLSAEVRRAACRDLVLMLAPFAPYTAEELWEEMGGAGPVFKQPWPTWDEELAREDEIEIPVQVNGKLRARIRIPAGASQQDQQRAALADEKVQSALAGRTPAKIILVPGKLVNLVVK